MNLARLQRDFAQSLTADGDSALLGQFCDHLQPDPAIRFAVYRNTVRGNWRSALEAAYPVVFQLVGPAFFHEAADRYVDSRPSASGDLHELGAGFAEFLREYSHAKTLPYLADAAHLDWAMHCAFHAADASRLELTRLAALAPEQWESLRFIAAPGTAVITSVWPVFTLWQAHQPGNALPEAFHLDQGGETVVVHRESWECVARCMDEVALCVLQAALDGAPLSRTLSQPELAHAADPAAALQGALQQLIAAGILVDFAIGTQMPPTNHLRTPA